MLKTFSGIQKSIANKAGKLWPPPKFRNKNIQETSHVLPPHLTPKWWPPSWVSFFMPPEIWMSLLHTYMSDGGFPACFCLYILPVLLWDPSTTFFFSFNIFVKIYLHLHTCSILYYGCLIAHLPITRLWIFRIFSPLLWCSNEYFYISLLILTGLSTKLCRLCW